MVRLPDVTATPPVRRMAVARGSLRLRVATCQALLGERAGALEAARAAALLAAKEAPRLLPAAVPHQLTDAFCDLDVGEGEVTCTVTVQGYARTTLEAPALLGVAAALLALWDALRDLEQEADGGFAEARVTGLHVVQNVVG